VPIRESPEIAALLRRAIEAWGRHDLDTFETFFSRTPHFRGIGTDADEYWESVDEYHRVNRTQLSELEGTGWELADGAVKRMYAVEEGPVGWATLDYSIRNLDEEVTFRSSVILVLEAGAWKIVHWHSSVGVPNVQSFGVELTTTLDDLLNAVSRDEDAQKVLARAEATMTLVFTDVVDSTALAERLGDQTWVALMKDHEADIRRITARYGGTLVKMIGDGSMLAFESARAAIRAALDIEQAADAAAFNVRIGVHSGEVVRTEGDLLGTTVNKAARVASVATGGQILVSSIVAELAGAVDGVMMGAHETVALKGLSGTHVVLPIRRARMGQTE